MYAAKYNKYYIKNNQLGGLPMAAFAKFASKGATFAAKHKDKIGKIAKKGVEVAKKGIKVANEMKKKSVIVLGKIIAGLEKDRETYQETFNDVAGKGSYNLIIKNLKAMKKLLLIDNVMDLQDDKNVEAFITIFISIHCMLKKINPNSIKNKKLKKLVIKMKSLTKQLKSILKMLSSDPLKCPGGNGGGSSDDSIFNSDNNRYYDSDNNSYYDSDYNSDIQEDE